MERHIQEMEKEFFFLRVKCRNKSVVMKFSSNEISYENFLHNALQKFGIAEHINFHVNVLDQDDFVIEKDDFKDFVNSYRTHFGFYLNIQYDVDFEKTPKIVTPFLIEEYLIKNNKDYVLREQKETSNLTESSRQKLIAALCDFMFLFFDTSSIQKAQKIMVAMATIQLFPQLESQNKSNGGVDIVYGYIENRLKYLSARKRKQIDATESQKNSESEIADNEQGITDTSDLVLRELIESMKNTVVNKDTIDEIKKKLKTTREYRRKMLADKTTDLLESFPYFFVNVDLILFEYQDRFDYLKADGEFNKHWDKYSDGLDTLIKTQYECNGFYTNWPEDIEKSLLVVLKLFPSSKLGKNKLAKRETFHNATEKLIVFRPIGTSPEQMIEKSNKHPYIIACGPSKKEISRYYIEVERTIICIPPSYDIVRTFDILFKIHHIFDLNFDKNIVNAVHFIQHFIFNMADINIYGKPSTRMEDVWNRLIRLQSPT